MFPTPRRITDYEDSLVRQNSLIHQGWRVFRWTDRQISNEPEQVKEQLVLFLERIPGLLEFDNFLPKQHGEVLELKPHQEEAIEALKRLRAEGNTIALVTHAQGAGKTVTSITDVRRIGGRTLFVAHTRELVIQARVNSANSGPKFARAYSLMRNVRQTSIISSVQCRACHGI